MDNTYGGVNPSKNNKKLKDPKGREVEVLKKITYANLLKPKYSSSIVEKIPPKLVLILHGEKSITWK